MRVQIIPKTPCRGVEDWNKEENTPNGTNCGGEQLWDSAFNTLTSGTDKGTWAMALNPSSRRSRHQVRPALSCAVQRCAALVAQQA